MSCLDCFSSNKSKQQSQAFSEPEKAPQQQQHHAEPVGLSNQPVSDQAENSKNSKKMEQAYVEGKEDDPVLSDSEDVIGAPQQPDEEENLRLRQFVNKGRRQAVSAEADEDKEADDAPIIPKTEDDTKRIIGALGNSFLFAELDDEEKQDVVSRMTEKVVKAGEEVIREGDNGDFFYIIEAGKYDVFKKGSKVFEYEKGGSFGELALMYNCPRAATVQAVTDGTLWCMSRSTFRRTLVHRRAERAKRYEEFLGKVPLFKHLTHGDLSKIADSLIMLRFKDGDYILRQGDNSPNQCFYIIEKGEVRATQRPQPHLAEVQVGGRNLTVADYFGERALISRRPRAANCIAVGDVICAAMDRASFERLMGECKDVLKEYMQQYVDVAEV